MKHYTPNIFKTKHRKIGLHEKKPIWENLNYAGRTKHYPAAVKE